MILVKNEFMIHKIRRKTFTHFSSIHLLISTSQIPSYVEVIRILQIF